MTTILTIDPGKWVLAWALWNDAYRGAGEPPTQLLQCGLSMVEETPEWKPEGNLGPIAMAHARNVAQVVNRVGRVVVEEMAHYPGQAQKTANAKARDLLELQAIGGVVAGQMTGSQIRYVRAGSWKGTVPKSVTRARVLEILTPRETGPLVTALDHTAKGLHHNLFDVIGIGLWASGRMKGRIAP